mmetsp:Transcript_152477/g.266158  ORF Transcript_152477/g.266158 Transcript_152477/m.266158 type:complete len:105 (+) Transcript_152477:644-958(+)
MLGTNPTMLSTTTAMPGTTPPHAISLMERAWPPVTPGTPLAARRTCGNRGDRAPCPVQSKESSEWSSTREEDSSQCTCSVPKDPKGKTGARRPHLPPENEMFSV